MQHDDWSRSNRSHRHQSTHQPSNPAFWRIQEVVFPASICGCVTDSHHHGLVQKPSKISVLALMTNTHGPTQRRFYLFIHWTWNHWGSSTESARIFNFNSYEVIFHQYHGKNPTSWFHDKQTCIKRFRLQQSLFVLLESTTRIRSRTKICTICVREHFVVNKVGISMSIPAEDLTKGTGAIKYP